MSESNWLADQFLRSVEGEAWHGPSLMEALNGVSHTLAAASPGAGKHGIWQQLLHVEAWMNAALRRTAGEAVELDPAQDWPAIGDATAERWTAAQTEFRAKAVECAERMRSLTEEDFSLVVSGREYNVRFLLYGLVQHTAYHTGQIALLKALDGKRDLLRHSLATLVYRGKKAITGAPDSFPTFQAGESSRTPLQILAHVDDLLDWALTLAEGQQAWRELNSGDWEAESARFFAGAEALETRLAAAATAYPAEKIYQGPIADATQHIGQITYLRRLAGAPIRGENYAKAAIETGRAGKDQAAPKREFD
ncbi:MAG: DinB family protein [Acidobacteria bacterium]|nr:DinB family protein [Acidobacteriota bacterium]